MRQAGTKTASWLVDCDKLTGRHKPPTESRDGHRAGVPGVANIHSAIPSHHWAIQCPKFDVVKFPGDDADLCRGTRDPRWDTGPQRAP